jgi:hypothetical protein
MIKGRPSSVFGLDHFFCPGVMHMILSAGHILPFLSYFTFYICNLLFIFPINVQLINYQLV